MQVRIAVLLPRAKRDARPLSRQLAVHGQDRSYKPRVVPRQEFRPLNAATQTQMVQCIEWPCKFDRRIGSLAEGASSQTGSQYAAQPTLKDPARWCNCRRRGGYAPDRHDDARRLLANVGGIPIRLLPVRHRLFDCMGHGFNGATTIRVAICESLRIHRVRTGSLVPCPKRFWKGPSRDCSRLCDFRTGGRSNGWARRLDS